MAKAVKYPAPKNETEAVRLMSDLEKLKLELDQKQKTLKQGINQLVATANREAEAISEEFAGKFNALKAYAAEHKSVLTSNGKRRSVHWVTGTLGWRSTPEGISVPRSAKERAILIKRILAAKKLKFLRRKWDLNVEAMEASPEEAEAIEGVNRRAARETFFVKFHEGGEIMQKIKLKMPSDKDLKQVD